MFVLRCTGTLCAVSQSAYCFCIITFCLWTTSIPALPEPHNVKSQSIPICTHKHTRRMHTKMNTGRIYPTGSIVKLLRTKAQIFKPPKNYETNSRWKKAIWLWKHHLDLLNDPYSTHQLTASISYASKYHHTDV